MKKLLAVITCIAMAFSLYACAAAPKETEAEPAGKYPNAKVIKLNDTSATIDGAAIKEFDYTRTISPDSKDDVFTGTEPNTDAAAYIAHDIIYYPELEKESFKAERYDGETEWVYHYTAEDLKDYIFATLPYWGDDKFPADMMHSVEDAYDNKVLHITKPGEYILEGTWHGQILIDLGDKDETFSDEDAKVTLILNGTNVTCDVAPALMFYSAYECDNTWEDRTTHTNETDLTAAGAKVVIADGTENNFTGTNVYRLLKAKYKNDNTTVQKKRYKIDAAFYSYVSMLIESEEKGTGILNITSDFEGLDSELHLTINSGYINIVAQNDGINVNEDGVSVLTVNGGHLNIFAGQGEEGDVIDSNGFIRVNGGFIAGSTPSPADNILDSDSGTYTDESATVINGSGSREGMGMMGGGQRPGNGNFDFGNGNFAPGERPNRGEMPGGNMGEWPMPDRNFGGGQKM